MAAALYGARARLASAARTTSTVASAFRRRPAAAVFLRKRTTTMADNDAAAAAAAAAVSPVVAKAAEVDASAAPAADAAAAGAPAASAAAVDTPEVTKLDIRVGKILSIDVHPDADGLYVETVDLGDPEPRTIVSGLVKFVPIEAMRGRAVVALCNLKPRNMRGVKSDGMLLCASDAAHERVEPLDPPAGSLPGERVGFDLDGARPGEQPEPASPNQIQKKKVWESIQPELKVSDAKVAGWKGSEMITSAGKVTAASLTGGNIS